MQRNPVPRVSPHGCKSSWRTEPAWVRWCTKPRAKKHNIFCEDYLQRRHLKIGRLLGQHGFGAASASGAAGNQKNAIGASHYLLNGSPLGCRPGSWRAGRQGERTERPHASSHACGPKCVPHLWQSSRTATHTHTRKVASRIMIFMAITLATRFHSALPQNWPLVPKIVTCFPLATAVFWPSSSEFQSQRGCESHWPRAFTAYVRP